jgi:hypothetical protein
LYVLDMKGRTADEIDTIVFKRIKPSKRKLCARPARVVGKALSTAICISLTGVTDLELS